MALNGTFGNVWRQFLVVMTWALGQMRHQCTEARISTGHWTVHWTVPDNKELSVAALDTDGWLLQLPSQPRTWFSRAVSCIVVAQSM